MMPNLRIRWAILSVAWLFIGSVNLMAQREFITKWVFTTSETYLRFGSITANAGDNVIYAIEKNGVAAANGMFNHGPDDYGYQQLAVSISPGDVVTLYLDVVNLVGFYVDAADQADNLIEVVQWGDAVWEDLSYAFASCPNFISVGTLDTPTCRCWGRYK